MDQHKQSTAEVSVSSSTSVPTGSTLNNTNLMSMLNVAVPLITQTVVTALQQSGLINNTKEQWSIQPSSTHRSY
jgi:hypothetical protein